MGHERMFDMPTLEGKLITITGHPVVKKNNQQVVGSGKSRRKINTPAYNAWLHNAEAQIAHYGHVEPIDYPVNISYRFYLGKSYNSDLSNLIEGPQDLLVAAQIITDDNWKIVASLDGSRVELDPTNPRVEILITAKNSYQQPPSLV